MKVSKSNTKAYPKIFFLASGIAVTYTDQGSKQILDIYRRDKFIGGQGFTTQEPGDREISSCLLIMDGTIRRLRRQLFRSCKLMRPSVAKDRR
jgi:hypothetical protein